MKQNLYNLGRCLIALYFLLPGIMKFAAWDQHIAMMEEHGMPMASILLPLAGLIQIGAAILIIVDRYTAIMAIVLAAMVVLINLNLHDFWNYSGIVQAHETQNFVKNLGILAGLLILAGYRWEPLSKSKISHA
ncbi:hypothetical protein CS022_19990 [Veronia nyctiphanis]|uniref:DoxX family protein n=1 Tax=Veronia nyctiphanis TaxID=1278244 RepID=A0A4Q0YS00_9GAMM|nr:DoxX family protein [Veronia nyctiphanis]RXJ71731.1 hypothetical protein CS022_19990 [Veronia nyctiphanis]